LLGERKGAGLAGQQIEVILFDHVLSADFLSPELPGAYPSADGLRISAHPRGPRPPPELKRAQRAPGYRFRTPRRVERDWLRDRQAPAAL